MGGLAHRASLSVGHRAALPAARSRWDLQSQLSGPGCTDGHRTGGLRRPLALQNPYVERLIGSIRRELLDHVIVIDEDHRNLLRSYFAYYHESRTHLSLGKDAPKPRPV